MASLVGRVDELAALLDLLAPENRGIVLIRGGAGIGKSRLLDEALRRVSRPVFRGEAVADSPSPYAPLVEALRRPCANHRDAVVARPLARYLGALIPELELSAVEADQPTLVAAICDAAAVAGAL